MKSNANDCVRFRWNQQNFENNQYEKIYESINVAPEMNDNKSESAVGNKENKDCNKNEIKNELKKVESYTVTDFNQEDTDKGVFKIIHRKCV